MTSPQQDRELAVAYLRPAEGAPWQWAEGGRVLVWHDGTTVAFWEEVVSLVDCFAGPGPGLPPFGALVLLLAATRGKVPAPGLFLTAPTVTLPVSVGPKFELLRAARGQLMAQITDACGHLARVRELPKDLVAGVPGRVFLAQTVFEAVKVERQTEASPVLRGMRLAPFAEEELNRPQPGEGHNLRHLHLVAQGLRPHTVESLQLRLRTGLDSLPAPADLAISPSDTARGLLDELEQIPEHAGLARAARELMAAIRLPRRLSQPEEFALGGVAGLTNRGSLDRLLLSELAHDDLTLAVRVALNEALYLRREPPAQEPPSRLALLLDVGIRLWGLPRLFGTAVALALVAAEARHATVLAWCAQGSSLTPVGLLTREGLAAQLGHLDTTAHPGGALARFHELTSQEQPATLAHTERILITHRDSLADPGFRRELQRQATTLDFIATVDREGEFQLHAVPLTGGEPLASARIDLAKLISERRPKVELRVPELDPKLPRIFRQKPFPLLLPVHGQSESVWPAGEGGVAVTSGRRLMRWRHPREGAVQLAAGIPGGRTHWLEAHADGGVSLIRGRQSERQLNLLHAAPNGEVENLVLEVTEVPAAFHRGGDTLLVIGPRETAAFRIDSGELLGRANTPGSLNHRLGRSFCGADRWWVVGWNGQAVQWEEFVPSGAAAGRKIIALFDRADDGLCLVTDNGEVMNAEGVTLLNAGRRLTGLAISRDGQRILADGIRSGERHLLDLPGQRIIPVSGRVERVLEPPPTKPSRRLVTELNAIEFGSGATLTLLSPKGGGLEFRPNARGAFMGRLLPRGTSRGAAARDFRPVPVSPALGCTLKVAEFPDGRRAYLDSRGLVHLCSHRAPEFTLVLAEGTASAWDCSGIRYGDAFYHGSQKVEHDYSLACSLVIFSHCDVASVST